MPQVSTISLTVMSLRGRCSSSWIKDSLMALRVKFAIASRSCLWIGPF